MYLVDKKVHIGYITPQLYLGVKISNILIETFLHESAFAQLSSNYILALLFFGKIILAQKLLVKC